MARLNIMALACWHGKTTKAASTMKAVCVTAVWTPTMPAMIWALLASTAAIRSSAYYGAHLGIGKVTGLNDTTKADVYAKLLYTHQNGDSVTLQGEGNGEVYDFDAGTAPCQSRGRVSKAYSERGTGYVAWRMNTNLTVRQGRQ
ncbi:MAG: hypothetical protein ACLR2G_05205 [Phascolarctobacterium faecium]